ncbi:diaminopropionate ammonia-lyase [Mycolicibacterium sp. YH-1]|uniref:diaminopropionate ammonia-lyase n=1 Tax=Mycolicibacterium sp. YH-1 TaxID=2908837 RepID=UPI001F4BDC57|nr:diaminopropionate ammonia-lyase [Mycolicibacterium sp. YH-1]UNB52882.1 diaminopropionate ammonia-lyase [Mycolicibacterium sp. YH-1]
MPIDDSAVEHVDDVIAFHRALPGYAPTRLVELPNQAGELAVGRLFVKEEKNRFGLPAFKALGASWALARAVAAQAGLPKPWTLPALRGAAAKLELEVVTATDGNHGRAVAWMAAQVGLSATVLVPDVIGEAATVAIAGEGAEVVVHHGNYDETVIRAARYAAEERGRLLVQDTAWPSYTEIPGWIVDGYQTLLAEVDTQLADLGAPPADLVVVPVGVGSLLQAVLSHYSLPHGPEPATKIASVEPVSAACVLASLRADRLTSVDTASTIMAGLNCGTPSSLAWPLIRNGLSAAIAVTDAEAAQSADLLAEQGVASGPCGAATLAAVRVMLNGSDSEECRDALGLADTSVVVLLSTEANSDSVTAEAL